MYEQVEKSKENKSRAVANSVAQKKSDVKQGSGFVDNRPVAKTQIKIKQFLQKCCDKENNEKLNHELKSVKISKQTPTNKTDSPKITKGIVAQRHVTNGGVQMTVQEVNNWFAETLMYMGENVPQSYQNILNTVVNSNQLHIALDDLDADDLLDRLESFQPNVNQSRKLSDVTIKTVK